MVLMAAHAAIVPMPEAAIFADTQSEPADVYRHLDWLRSGVLPFPVHVVTAGNLAEHVAAERPRGKYLKVDIPVYAKAPNGSVGIINRSCTRDFKIRPITKQCRELVNVAVLREWRKKHRDDLRLLAAYAKYERAVKRAKREKQPPPPYMPYPQASWDRVQADALVTQWIGISLDEASRMKPSREPWIAARWPLIELRMRRHDCLRWLKEHGYREPSKSACIFCPYHGADQWQALTPDEFGAAVEIDRRLRSRPPEAYRAKGTLYLHRSCQPLEFVDFSTSEQRGQLSMFDNECEGMCGV